MQKYDVIILGGGFAGLTLAYQLKQSRPEISMLILEKRSEKAPVAAHKVGESLVELGAYYLREVLDLKTYLDEHQLPKFGFRFFFSEEQRGNIARRVELGSNTRHLSPAHQIDRGLLENELLERLKNENVDIISGATIKEVDLSKDGHKVYVAKADKNFSYNGSWVIDATGRRSFLKRKLKLNKITNHNINAAWFRLGCTIDIDSWSDDKLWHTHVPPGYRRLATNHLVGKGYWVWLISLVSGNTSIGIVADPDFHDFDKFNTFEKALKWLTIYEPVAAEMLGNHRNKLLDFKVMKGFSHDSKQFYSSERWGITGDAGAFMDALYSPGIDFIALSNTWITELILRDLNGENIVLPTMVYGHAHRGLLNGWALLYKDMYRLFGKTQIMLLKIVWDWATYWAVPSLMFINNGYTSVPILKKYAATADGIGQRFAKLNQNMQSLFLTWSQYDIEPCSDRYLNIFDLDCVHKFYQGLSEKHDEENLMLKVRANLKILEQIASEIFRLVSSHLNGTPPDLKVDPYRMDIDDGYDELLHKSKGEYGLGVDASIKADISNVWLISTNEKSKAYAS